MFMKVTRRAILITSPKIIIADSIVIISEKMGKVRNVENVCFKLNVFMADFLNCINIFIFSSHTY